MKLTLAQRSLLTLVGDNMFGLNHDDDRLDRFCSPTTELDVFNACHRAGWLKTAHDTSSGVSIVSITPAGCAALTEQKP